MSRRNRSFFPAESYFLSRRNSGNGRNGLRPAMRHDYPPVARMVPHPSKGAGPWQGGRGVEVTDPTPRYAHPSPTMGGELITTSACNYAPVSIVQNFCHFRDFCGTKKQLFLRDKNNPILRDKKICEICEICVRLKLYICVK